MLANLVELGVDVVHPQQYVESAQGAFQRPPAGPRHQQGDRQHQAEAAEQFLADAEVVEKTSDRTGHDEDLALDLRGYSGKSGRGAAGMGTSCQGCHQD
ncbi:hypothetical protein D3C72_1846020 [compost metagenome]